MGSLKDAKLLGGIGAILSLFIPIVGVILVLIAVKYISDVTNDRSIFNNMLIAIILVAIGSLAAYLFILPSLFVFISNPFAVLTYLIVALIIGFITLVIGAIFLKKSFDRIAELVNVNHFKTAALLFLIGAILIIVLVGAFIILVAEIFMIVAFFSLPEELPKKVEAPPPLT